MRYEVYVFPRREEASVIFTESRKQKRLMPFRYLVPLGYYRQTGGTFSLTTDSGTCHDFMNEVTPDYS